MRFRPRLIPGVQTCALLALAFSLMGLQACSDQHIGRPCQLGLPGDVDAGTSTGTTTATISSPALECPSRICILPPNQTGDPQMTGSLCTAGCSSNDDCSDSEGRSSDNAHGCVTGFVCMYPTTTGSFACKKLCVCHDFVDEPSGGFTKPADCP